MSAAVVTVASLAARLALIGWSAVATPDPARLEILDDDGDSRGTATAAEAWSWCAEVEREALPPCSVCDDERVAVRGDECESCRTCSRCDHIADARADLYDHGREHVCEDCHEGGRDCGVCGGHGGGPDPELLCRACGGSGGAGYSAEDRINDLADRLHDERHDW